MNNQSTFEQLKKEKELSDIIAEQNKILYMLNNDQEEELKIYLQNLKTKCAMESFVYNMVNPNMPTTTAENAQNCIQFLRELYIAKATKPHK